MNPAPAPFPFSYLLALRMFATLALVIFSIAPRVSAAFVHLQSDYAKQLVSPHLAATLDQAILAEVLLDDQPSTPRNRFGRMTLIAWPLYMALRFLHARVIGNWGTDIILMTVLFNLAMIWPRVKSMKSSAKMARLKPQIEAIRTRHIRAAPNTSAQSEINAEIMALYQSEGVSVVGGCLPLLFQMPLLFGLFSVFQNAAELNHAHWLWLTDLARPDPLHILPAIIIASMMLAVHLALSRHECGPTEGPRPRHCAHLWF
jgi:YidC/Oxa1 family membrane protein insertase